MIEDRFVHQSPFEYEYEYRFTEYEYDEDRNALMPERPRSPGRSERLSISKPRGPRLRVQRLVRQFLSPTVGKPKSVDHF